jgi:hypothetical protein
MPIPQAMNLGMNTSKAESIRKSFRDWTRHRSRQEIPHSMLETTLVHGGRYVGRRFSLVGFSLIWSIDDQRIEVFEPDGTQVVSQKIEEFCAVSEGTQASKADQ